MASNVFINSRPHGADILLMQMTDQQVGKSNGMDIGFKLTQTDGLSYERFTDESFASCPSEFRRCCGLAGLDFLRHTAASANASGACVDSVDSVEQASFVPELHGDVDGCIAEASRYNDAVDLAEFVLSAGSFRL